LKESEKQTILGLNLTNGSCLFLEKGFPSREDEARVQLSIATSTNALEDRNFHTFEDIGEIPICVTYNCK